MLTNHRIRVFNSIKNVWENRFCFRYDLSFFMFMISFHPNMKSILIDVSFIEL